jgi:hypothetical protein
MFHLVPTVGRADLARQGAAFGQPLHGGQRAGRCEFAREVQGGHAAAVVGNHADAAFTVDPEYCNLHACSLGGPAARA